MRAAGAGCVTAVPLAAVAVAGGGASVVGDGEFNATGVSVDVRVNEDPMTCSFLTSSD